MMAFKCIVSAFFASILNAALASGASFYPPTIPLHGRIRNGYPLHAVPHEVVAELDVFLGPFCEDSRKAFPTFKALAQYNSQRGLAVRLHLFPLPYNHLSFLPAQVCVSAGIIANATAVVNCMEFLYTGDHQATIKTHALYNYTVPRVIDELVSVVSEHLRMDKEQLAKQMQQGLESGAESYTRTKSDWKYGTSLGVFATPSVFVNGVQIFGYTPSGDHAEGALADMTMEQWQSILDPVLPGSNHAYEV